MPDPSIARFRRVVTSAYAYLEARRQEVNDLNVFPVADGDTGDNMAMTMRAVMEELDRLDGQEVDEIGRTELVQALARAALMGARGNSGVILSQIVRGAAEELASRPGELIDPVLVASAFASAADAAYDSVREPAEGTMLTVFREMAHSLARQLAHLDADKQRLGRDVSEEQQDEVLAEVLERAIADGERAVARTPEQLEVLRESGVVDAGGYGLVLILAGVVAGLRGDGRAARGHRPPRRRRASACPTTRTAASATAPTSSSPAAASQSREFLPRLEGLGDSVLVVGDEATLKVHVHTDEPEAAVALFDGAGAVTNLDVADMREQMAEREARLQAGRTGVVAVAAGDGLRAALRRARRPRRPRRRDAQPLHLRAAGRDPRASPAEEVLVLPSSSNVIMAAERACELSEKPARVVAGDLPAGEPAGPGRARPRGRRRRRTPSGWRRRSAGSPPAASPRRPATTPRGASARATRSASPTARSSPGAAPARPWRRRSSDLAEGRRDRHRDRRRGGADRRSTRSTPTSPTGSRSRPTRAASRAGGGCSPPQ